MLKTIRYGHAAMRRSLPLVTTVTALAVAIIGNAAPGGVVYLDGPKSLAQLERINPGHYARAERIIAAAGELCKPGPLESFYAALQASDISCSDSLLKTSNPAKKELAFSLDGTRYLALIVVTGSAAKRMPLG